VDKSFQNDKDVDLPQHFSVNICECYLRMEVQSPPTKFVDQEDGQPIRSVEPVGSRYQEIAVKKLKDGGVEIRAVEHGTEEITEFQATLTDEMYRGVDLQHETRRRTLDNDIEDVLQLLGYTVTDPRAKGY
jgi:hypothetical protein